jgi:hypothetical protein
VISGGQTGALDDPYEWTFASDSATLNTDLELNYDPESSILVLSDNELPNPVISTTSIVPGRTVLIDDVNVSGTTEESVIGLSNQIFPPESSPNLIGNNPPSVAFPNPQTGLTNWFPGASFKAIISGTINDFFNNDDLVLTVYSNRGQGTQNILNTFTLNLESVSGFSGLGWKWTVNFTCRSINNGGVLGIIATNSEFNYSNDSIQEPIPEGFVISNVNSSFDTTVTQYLDFTMRFVQSGNSITTNLFTIERIY